VAHLETSSFTIQMGIITVEQIAIPEKGRRGIYSIIIYLKGFTVQE
jgi:hypothetical protein